MVYAISRHAFFFLVVMLLAPASAFAVGAAKLQVYPTRVNMKDGQRSAFVSVINSGTATGQYRAQLTDMVMHEEGILVPAEEGSAMQFSAKDYVRISPRSITVPPGQSQKFRLLARVPKSAPDGEYRTHIDIMMSSDNTERVEVPKIGFSPSVQPRLRISFPVVILKGETSFTASINNITLREGVTGNPVALVEFLAEGNRSASGTLIITLNKGGKSYEVYNSGHVSVYRGLKRRVQPARLNLPDGVTLAGGMLKATYLSEEDDNKVLAEKTVQF